MDDKKLVQDFLRWRSEHAFLCLYNAKSPHLYQMALRLTQNTYHSEELLQETWIVAIRKLEEFQWKSELKTWLVAILINLYRSMRRTESKEITSQALPLEAVPSMSFEVSLTVTDLEKAIAQLPAGYRQVVVLHDVEGFTHKEIATLLDIAEGTSKSQLYHARKALRGILKAYQ